MNPLENLQQLSAWSSCLPACRVSECVQQLLELAVSTLCEAVGSTRQWYASMTTSTCCKPLNSLHE